MAHKLLFLIIELSFCFYFCRCEKMLKSSLQKSSQKVFWQQTSVSVLQNDIG
ncbi:hypothetical protein DU19_0176 [Chlamydia muridarum]|nr:hypothetical protein DU17_0176 [Chlamydia muridarum]KDU81148.1 hypothetical protein DU18_0177 [Chlamydia muridarum]KDU82899.1 hypothetical protein DU19_0176 [Chlamydia muridarum]KDU83100.1 hypothetical protein DU20_0176 [Chlamydia muridarum]KDU84103.1 hypothetical protein DU21_0176 [Chlamydia muridarum]